MFTNLGIARFGSILTTSRLLAAPTGDDEEDDDENDGYGSTSSRGSAVSSSSVAIFSSTFKGKHRRALRSLAGTVVYGCYYYQNFFSVCLLISLLARLE